MNMCWLDKHEKRKQLHHDVDYYAVFMKEVEEVGVLSASPFVSSGFLEIGLV